MSRVFVNEGGAGIDGYTVYEMEKEWDQFRDSLQKELKAKTYQPSPLLRKVIPKEGGKERQLSIPTVKDRVVQCIVKLLIEPIFEADFHDESYGYRPEKRPHDAVESISKAIYGGKTTVIEADLSRYFDTINHDRLLKLIRNRVSDGSILKLIKDLLRVSLVEEKRQKRKAPPPKGKRRKKARKPKKVRKHHPKLKVGVPQGGVFSPLMGNLYLDALDKAVNALNPYAVKMVRYADDFVIMVKPGWERHLLERTEKWLTRVGLQLNRDKTKCTDTKAGGKVEFLSFEMSERYSPKTGKRYIHKHPSKKATKKYRDKVRKLLNHSTTWRDPVEVIKEVNEVTRGWKSYFHFGMSRDTFNYQNHFLGNKVRRWLRAKYKRKTSTKSMYEAYPNDYLEQELGLYKLPLNLKWLA